MRVLLANHHLQYRAGSELYCLELATALQRVGHWEAEEQARRAEHERLLAQLQHQRSELEARARALEAELGAKVGEAANLQAELASEQLFRQQREQELEAIHTSMAWKGVNLLRALKDRTLFVPHTRSRWIYDRVLQRLKAQ
ncbi:hypothetical protein [Hyalangium minutum]|uniref:Uncharacterized protein n=1 Tax=Hyalangium minutum TaxID=394096 RepID=A0A085WQN8_9BACT|nr:hypothetical protein [Hyalangium minutum]KFE70001.1 hypothetical protein DB31_5043 [Hyalangium minutum]